MNETITVKLTAEQVKDSRKELREILAMEGILVELIDRIAERRVARESALWDQMHEICGTNEETHRLNIHWISGTLTATPHATANNGSDE